ncbi:MAG: transposase [Actinomycetota bacterium]|nr:transposase [Actinomycetota bacterium]
MTESDADRRREMRWSANKKADVVLRLLRGEPIDEVSRAVGVEAHRLAAWRDEFLAAGKEGLKGRVPAEDGVSAEQRRRLREAERKVGELTLDNDILRAAARKRGLEIPPAKRPR